MERFKAGYLKLDSENSMKSPICVKLGGNGARGFELSSCHLFRGRCRGLCVVKAHHTACVWGKLSETNEVPGTQHLSTLPPSLLCAFTLTPKHLAGGDMDRG